MRNTLEMDTLYTSIQKTPIIDHHAHNLLLPSHLDAHDLLSMFTEASGPALKHSTSALAHIRAVKQLATVLGCDNTWPAVQDAIRRARDRSDDAWARRCFEGIETALIDDGLDPSNVHPYHWHDHLTRSKCKRIVRIERIAEGLITDALYKYHSPSADKNINLANEVMERFSSSIEGALADPEVSGFKSVICYRTGLAITGDADDAGADVLKALMDVLDHQNNQVYTRLEHGTLGPYFVNVTASLVARSNVKKPFQFHTGLGDNDINLGLSNPSHLQPFIKKYSTVPIVLLHASYPFTTEAGYLASVYENGIFPGLTPNDSQGLIYAWQFTLILERSFHL